MENRLKRQIEFLLEETEETRALLEEVRSQSESDLAKISQSQANTLKDLQDADAKITHLQMHQQLASHESSDAMMWKKKSEHLETQLQASEDELQQVKNLQELSRKESAQKQSSMSTPKSKSEKLEVYSPAPPEIMTELHRTRATLSDAQRNSRIQARKSEKIEAQLQDVKPKLEMLNMCQNKIVLLERENKVLRKENEMGKVLDDQWSSFRHDIQSLFETNSEPGENTPMDTSIENDDHNARMAKRSPIEIATIVRRFRDIQNQLEESRNAERGTNNKLTATKQRVSYLEKEIKETDNKIAMVEKEKEVLHEKLLCASMDTRKSQAQETISKREADGLRDILDTFALKPEKSPLKPNQSESPSEVSTRSLRLSLSSSQEKLTASMESYKELKDKMGVVVEEKETMQKELDRVKEKYGKLKEALMKEKEKVENAEERAVSLPFLVCSL